jgi:Family of unknown function (DUF6328)
MRRIGRDGRTLSSSFVRLRLRPLNDTARANPQNSMTPFCHTSESQSKLMKKAQMAVEEARMVVPGLQALFGFQMVSIFVETLSRCNQFLHLFAIFLTTLSIALIMSPAAYHRIVEPEIGSKFFVHFTSRLIAAAMVPLMISLTVDAYIVAIFVVRSAFVSAMIAVSIFAVFAGLWFAYPLAKRRRALQSAAR